MENASLFCVGSVRGIRTAAIGTIDGSPFKWDEGDYDPHGAVVGDGKMRMIKTGLRVAKNLYDEMKSQGQLPDHALAEGDQTGLLGLP